MRPLEKMRCGECGHLGLEMKNMKGEYRSPWKDFRCVLLSRDLELPRCPHCGNVVFNGTMGDALNQALELSVRDSISALLRQVMSRGELSGKRLSQILGVTPEYFSMLLTGKKTGSFQLAQMLRALCMHPELIEDLEKPMSTMGMEQNSPLP
jgi:hypothetical protein